MGGLKKHKTEGGSGDKRGHSNMDHWAHTEEIKAAGKIQRRIEDKNAMREGGRETELGSKSPEPEVVRVDPANRRVFIVSQVAVTENKQAIRKLVQSVKAEVKKKNWGRDWSASFFAAPHLVGYKDEPHLAKYLQSGEWQRGYLAEYSHERCLFVLQPAMPSARVEVWLD